MNCDEARTMIHAYMDGELDLVRNIEIEHHLEACTECSKLHAQYQGIQNALRSGPLYYEPPGTLVKSVRLAVRKAEKPAPPSLLFRSWRLYAVPAAFALLCLALWRIVPIIAPKESNELLAEEILQSHVRSLMIGHLTDVPSSDQHTVKPWFNGKVDFSPVVKDLSAEGFVLIGGRLDYIDNRAVAALVYQRRKHIVNLFTWPSSSDSHPAEEVITRQGYHFLSWRYGEMVYYAISDLNPLELEQLRDLVRR